jgi:hypothetical protein
MEMCDGGVSFPELAGIADLPGDRKCLFERDPRVVRLAARCRSRQALTRFLRAFVRVATSRHWSAQARAGRNPYVIPQSPSLPRRRYPAYHVSTRLDTGRGSEHDRLSLLRNHSDQWLNGEPVGYQHERPRSTPAGNNLL